ncbi:MAG: ABC transporter permease [Thermoplasmataceae archaeon]
MDAEVSSSLLSQESKEKRNPGLENLKITFKLFFKSRLAFVGFIITLIYFVIAIMDTVYPQYLGVTNLSSMVYLLHGQVVSSSATPVAPSFNKGWYFWLGTTEFNFPILPAILESLKFDMSASILIVGVGAIIGVIIGTVSGYFGGITDETVMRITDIFFSLPFFVFAIAMVAILQVALHVAPIDDIVIALVIIWWPIYARLSRGTALTIKSQKFVEAATASGSSGMRNVFVHIMPNVLSAIFVQFSLDLGTVVGIFAGLDYLGINFGGTFFPELGNLIAEGQPYFGAPYVLNGQILGSSIWWPVLMPGIALLIFIVAVNLMGDGLRDVLDPKLRR